MHPSTTLAVAFFILVLSQASTIGQQSIAQAEPASPKVPMPIRQGPLLLTQQTPSQYYWYQVGAIGNSSSYNFVGANITIRTVYDQVNNDAHSYWIGGYISNGAFIQVGYLNGVSTTGQPYCCAWFYEYFPAGQSTCCPPVIGREGTAGPIGSRHEYSMVHTVNGVWSFYMDGKLLGSTPNLGASSSGNHAPAGIAEVAQASSNTDILGPAEFEDMWFLTTTWQRVPAANSLIWYGTGTPLNPPPPANPYGVANVTGINNAFLAGSGIPQPSSPSPNPGPSLWDIRNPPNLPSQVSISFLDTDQFSFSPEWVSLRQSSGADRVFYTDSHYPNYQNLKIGNGNWVVDRVMWHTVNVVGQGATVAVPGTPSLTVQTTVSSLRLRVVGVISGLPVSGASALTILPDTTNATAKTDSSGLAVLARLPPGTYYLRITVPYGIPAITSHDLLGPSELTARVLGVAEMLIIVITPIVLSVFVVILAVRRERLRAASMPTIPPSIAVTGNCRNCGTPLHVTDVFCPACNTSVKAEPSQVGPSPGL
ncbi:MAG TPA: hypothetical protein VIK88_04125 [Candidatus Bathyarchaeia archaeon]